VEYAVLVWNSKIQWERHVELGQQGGVYSPDASAAVFQQEAKQEDDGLVDAEKQEQALFVHGYHLEGRRVDVVQDAEKQEQALFLHGYHL
jgi:hypothetical protein